MKLPDSALSQMHGTITTGFDFTTFDNHSIFNKLSSTSDFGFNYFPYGYHFRYSKWGTINDLGFRCKHNLQWYKENRERLYLIILLGGSAAFDILVPDTDTMAFSIQEYLRLNPQILKKIKKCV